MANLVWVETYISEHVVRDAIGIVIRNSKRFILVCVYLLHNCKAYIGMR